MDKTVAQTAHHDQRHIRPEMRPLQARDASQTADSKRKLMEELLALKQEVS